MLPKKPLVKKSRVCRRSKQVSKQAAKPWLFAGVEDSGGGGKKIRKPYTITKSRESWTDQEHDKFLEALQLFDRDWKKIEAFVGSKTVIQIRSHAQKYFLKVQKNGTREHVPPPRSKRKAAHPYPQKAPKNVTMPQTSPVFISASQPDLEYYQIPETVSVLQKSGSSFPTTSWVHHTVPPIDVAFIGKGCEVTLDEVGQTCVTPRNVSRSTDSCPCTWHTQSKTLDKGDAQVRVKPDFSQVYQFIGSVFDPDTSDHLKKLQKLDPIDVETVLLLMRNLSVNLHSPEFEEHKLLLSSYDANTGEGKDAMCQDVDESMALVATGEMQSEGKAKVQEHESSEGQLKGNEVQVSADSLRCNPNESTVTGTPSFHSNVDEASEISSYFSNEHPA